MEGISSGPPSNNNQPFAYYNDNPNGPPPAYNPNYQSPQIYPVQQPPLITNPQQHSMNYPSSQPPSYQIVNMQPQSQRIVYQNTSNLPLHPTNTMCPICKKNVTTKVRMESGLLTWLICGGCCLAGLWIGCCCIPFCIDQCKDAVHECSECSMILYFCSNIYIYHN